MPTSSTPTPKSKKPAKDLKNFGKKKPEGSGKRGKTTIKSTHLAWTLLADYNCMWATDISPGMIEKIPVTLSDGRSLEPGARCTHLGGKKTAAGTTVITMLPGEYLSYVGRISSLDGELLLFNTREPKSHYVAFWMFQDKSGLTLFHSTPSNAGRDMETTQWVFENP